MTNKEIARRARGRIRRARQKRQRHRTIGVVVLTLIALLAFTSTAFDFLQRDRVRVLAGHRSYFYQFPEITMVIAEAKRSIADVLPNLLKLDSLFPKLRRSKISAQEDDEENGQLVDVKPLDDLRAAPPKELFLDAIFETGGLETNDSYPRIRLSRDFTGKRCCHIGGDPGEPSDPPPPVIPEPSTGLMLSLGLVILTTRSRSRSADTSAIP